MAVATEVVTVVAVATVAATMVARLVVAMVAVVMTAAAVLAEVTAVAAKVRASVAVATLGAAWVTAMGVRKATEVALDVVSMEATRAVAAKAAAARATAMREAVKTAVENVGAPTEGDEMVERAGAPVEVNREAAAERAGYCCKEPGRHMRSRCHSQQVPSHRSPAAARNGHRHRWADRRATAAARAPAASHRSTPTSQGSPELTPQSRPVCHGAAWRGGQTSPRR